MLIRRGASLLELIIAMTLAAMVFATATASVFRSQKTHTHLAGLAATDAQLRAGTALIAAQLAEVDGVAGDLTPNEVADSAIQLRATVASALACDNAAGHVTLLPDPPGAVSLQGWASAPRPGDTLWILRDSAWTGARITSVSEENAVCPAPFVASGVSLRLTLAGTPDTVPAGAPLRVTRPTRYAFYRSGDGTWQLGFREWNDVAGSFSAPQPVAGPFVHGGSQRSRFRYFDAAGQELTALGNERQVARVRIMTYSMTLAREAGQDSVRADSLDVALLRGARQ